MLVMTIVLIHHPMINIYQNTFDKTNAGTQVLPPQNAMPSFHYQNKSISNYTNKNFIISDVLCKISCQFLETLQVMWTNIFVHCPVMLSSLK